MNRFILNFVNRIYQYIFGYPMGERAKKFIENFGIFMGGSIIASLLSFGVFIIAGRIMGPEEYGKANLVFSLSNFLIIPMSFGLNISVMRYLNDSRFDRARIFSAAFFILIISAIVFSGIFYCLKDPISSSLGVAPYLLILSLVFTVSSSFGNVFQSTLVGLHIFRKNSLFTIITSIFFVALVLISISIFRAKSFDSLVIPAIFRFMIFALLAGALLRTYFVLKLEKNTIFSLLKFSAIATLGLAPGFLIFDMNRLLIQSFFGATYVGLFSAYILVLNFVAMRGIGIFLNVFYPTSSAIEDKKSIFNKTSHLFLYFSPLLFVSFSIATSVTILFFGKSYSFDAVLVGLTSLAYILFICATTYSWLIASVRFSALLYVSVNTLIAIFINLLIFRTTFSHFGLYGVLAGIIIAYTYEILVFSYYFRRLYTIAGPSLKAI